MAKPKHPKKVYGIESEYDDMCDAQLFRKCARCRKSKHIHEFGTGIYSNKALKCCELCREYNRYYNALRNYPG
jgi:hypothetical protein